MESMKAFYSYFLNSVSSVEQREVKSVPGEFPCSSLLRLNIAHIRFTLGIPFVQCYHHHTNSGPAGEHTFRRKLAKWIF